MPAIVAAAIADLRRLLDLLDGETERLKTRDIEGLEQLLSDKLSLLRAVEHCEQQRQAAVRAAGYTADRAGMQAYLADAGDAALSAAWSELKALLQRLQIINEANGNIIQRGLDQLDTQLALLRGGPAEGGGAYGPAGTRSRPGGREISRA